MSDSPEPLAEKPEPAAQVEKDRAPATLVIAASWVVVYGFMALAQGKLHAQANNWLSGGIQPAIAAQFGSLSSDAVGSGQFQRTLTATFIHFSLVHLIINTLVFYQLGRIVEPWYGSGAFLVLYAVIGVGSNALACILRPLLGQSSIAQSGGGSGIICGLIGLIAVVGWRQRSRFGDYMLTQMGIQLVLIGLMGMVIRNVDNLVHACGAVTGALAGLADPLLLRCRKSRISIALAIPPVLMALACIFAQRVSNHTDQARLNALAERDQQLRQQLIRLLVIEPLALRIASAGHPIAAHLYPAAVAEFSRDRAILAAALAQSDALEQQTHALGGDPRIPFEQWLELAEIGLSRRPTPNQISLFRKLHMFVVGRVEQAIRDNIANHQRLCGRLATKSLLGLSTAEREALVEESNRQARGTPPK
jgi:membrane associated rhomboid family serine protease